MEQESLLWIEVGRAQSQIGFVPVFIDKREWLTQWKTQRSARCNLPTFEKMAAFIFLYVVRD
jgi:hypothetical protein